MKIVPTCNRTFKVICSYKTFCKDSSSLGYYAASIVTRRHVVIFFEVESLIVPYLYTSWLHIAINQDSWNAYDVSTL